MHTFKVVYHINGLTITVEGTAANIVAAACLVQDSMRLNIGFVIMGIYLDDVLVGTELH